MKVYKMSYNFKIISKITNNILKIKINFKIRVILIKTFLTIIKILINYKIYLKINIYIHLNMKISKIII